MTPYVVAKGIRLCHEEHGSGVAIARIDGTSSSAMVCREAVVECLSRFAPDGTSMT